MMKNQVAKTVAFIAVFGITGIIAYTAVRLCKDIAALDDLELDFGNDEGIMSMFNRDDD
jgi:hypothetical protein